MRILHSENLSMIFSYFRQMRSQSASTASGFIINDRRILSNAHAVSNSSVIRIQKHGDTKKYLGRILHIAHECDLVMLTVDDNQFWNNVNPLIFSDILPELQDSILVVGYPIGKYHLYFFSSIHIINICFLRR